MNTGLIWAPLTCTCCHVCVLCAQVDVWCSQTQQRIVGYYQANACASDSRWEPSAPTAPAGLVVRPGTRRVVWADRPDKSAFSVAEKHTFLKPGPRVDKIKTDLTVFVFGFVWTPETQMMTMINFFII